MGAKGATDHYSAPLAPWDIWRERFSHYKKPVALDKYSAPARARDSGRQPRNRQPSIRIRILRGR